MKFYQKDGFGDTVWVCVAVFIVVVTLGVFAYGFYHLATRPKPLTFGQKANQFCSHHGGSKTSSGGSSGGVLSGPNTPAIVICQDGKLITDE
jgi:hypothetical protein